MDYYFLCKNFFEEYEHTNNIEKSIKNYIDNNYNILNDIYFLPKKIEQNKIEEIIKDSEYKKVLLNMISNLKGINLNQLFIDIVDELVKILDYENINKKVYVIIGLNTTTIYSTKYQDEDVTIILLESTLGLEENIKMLVPNKQKNYYTIVPNTTVEWVENNIETIDKVVEIELDKNNMMYDFFYMFAKTKIP